MAESLAGLTALPESVTVAGREVKLYPLTMADVGAWNRWARAQLLEPGLQACAALEGAAREDAQRAVFNEAKRISFWDAPSFPIMDSTDGRLKTLALSVAHGPAPMTEAELRALFCGETGFALSALSDAAWIVYSLSGYVSMKRCLEVLGKIPAPKTDEKKTETPTKP